MDEKAQAIRFMTETVGWQLVEQHIQGRIEAARNQLMTCQGWDDVIKHRATANALHAVLVHIETTLKEDDEN